MAQRGVNVSMATPDPGALVRVRGERWIVADVAPSANSTVVELQSVADGRYGETLKVVWEVEPGREILPAGSLPQVRAGAFDKPERLAAFLDAVRWSAVTSADARALQSPFRAGVAVEPYQLEPVVRAVENPRVNLLLADDVGLGKTIEAGLVAQELLLRHRARRVLVVCPAGLTLKWHDEMAEKFGLDFTVIDSECCAQLRRSHGSAANPFHTYPLAIVSLPWLRGPKGQRLLGEVLDGVPEHSTKRYFDLLILDEAHHVAPAAPKQKYAVDSQQTKLMRRLVPHFEHRLFLSATPHNGYQESFTALLELIDDQRFARGMTPDPEAERDTVVRRLKKQIVAADGSSKFVQRQVKPIPVEYPEGEIELHRQLAAYARLRKGRVKQSKRGGKAADLVTLLLKKRFFSSPSAFSLTVGQYLDTLEKRVGRSSAKAAPTATHDEEIPDWLEGYEDIEDLDDEGQLEQENDLLRRSGQIQLEIGGTGDATEVATQDRLEIEALRRMLAWSKGFDNRPDAKAAELIKYLEAVCRPDKKHWTNERVVVFTEYRDTQAWLARLLQQAGLGEPDRIEQLHGGLNEGEREAIRLAFQSEPSGVAGKVRILLATDAAGEGIDLQDHCHRLVNYDVPFNPNKLEQRIGRIDRYGQQYAPEIFHFVGTGRSGDEYASDQEFLDRLVRKVAQMEEDLGEVNAVLSKAMRSQMLGARIDVDQELARAKAAKPRTGSTRLAANKDVRDQVQRCAAQVEATINDLSLTPDRMHRVVATALELANKQPLTPYEDFGTTLDSVREFLEPGEAFEVPPLDGTFRRATEGLIDPLTERQRPVTFDPNVWSRHRKDVVLAHLSHPLVANSIRLLRAAVWDDSLAGLHRVTAVVSSDPKVETTFIGAFARFVLVGADGVRLHEEVLPGGGWLRDGRFNRLENLGTVNSILERALAENLPAAAQVRDRVAEAWPRIEKNVVGALEWRRDERLRQVRNRLAEREQDELRRIDADFERFARGLRRAIDSSAEQDEASEQMLWTAEAELAQARRDRESWGSRLAKLDAAKKREISVVGDRYREITPHLFPIAVVCVIPRKEAVR